MSIVRGYGAATMRSLLLSLAKQVFLEGSGPTNTKLCAVSLTNSLGESIFED